MREHRNSVWTCLLAAALLAAGPAFAQQVNAPAAAVVGENGIKLGDARLHPFFDLELRFDSAAGFFPGRGTTALVLQPEFVGHFRPGLRLDLLSDTVGLDVSGNVDYVFFTGLLVPGSQSASRLEAAADVNAQFNRKGVVEFDVGNHFSRSDRTANAALGVGVISLYNEARASVPIHPGGGALEIAPKVAVGIEFFDPISTLPISGCVAGEASCDPTAVRGMNYSNIRPGLEGRWRFLPKTAVLLDATFDIRNYFAGANPSAQLLKASAGLAGLLTTKVAVIAKVGWGYDFAGSGANTLIAHLEGSYLLSETSVVKAGYLRSLEPVPTYGAYGDDRGYVDAKFFFSGRVTLHGSLAFDYLSFYAQSAALQGRADTVLTLDLGPQYQITPWLIATGGYVLGVRGSNRSRAESINFTRNEAYLRVTFTY